MEYVIIGVSIIIGILISNYATQILITRYPTTNKVVITIFNVALYVAIIMIGIEGSKKFDLSGAFEKQSKELSVSIVNRAGNPIIGSDLVLKSSDAVVWRFITQPAQSYNIITYECKSTRLDSTVSTSCNSKAGF
jgi:hypothetical protein